MASMMGMSSSSMSQMSSSMMSLWSELLPGNDGELISDMVYDQYDLEAGRWPEAANELVLLCQTKTRSQMLLSMRLD